MRKMIKRRKTRTVTVGDVKIGSDHPVVIQSMAKTDTSDTAATIREIRELEACGCEMVRVAVKGMEAAYAISAIKKEITIPLVADIHFDHELALERHHSAGTEFSPAHADLQLQVHRHIRALHQRQRPSQRWAVS